MVLESVNRMDGGIRGAMNSMGRLRISFINTAKETSKLNPVSGWANRINEVTRKMDEFGKKAQSIRDKAEQSFMNGLKDVSTGGAIAAPVVGSIKQAADAQTKWTTMRTMGVSQDEVGKIKENTLQLSQGLTFDFSQVQGIALAINKAGVNGEKLLKMQDQATKYSQLEYYRYGSDPNQTATHLAHIAETAGVLRVDRTEKERYGLNSQDDIDKFVVNKFNKMTETLNKVVSVTSSDTAAFAESFKYSMSEARALGWSDESAMLMAGIYSRFGIEGSMSGTHLKDFAARLNPYQHYIGEDVEKRSNRLTAMQEAGWLEGAQWVTTKTGHKKFSSAGQSVFHNTDGTLKDPAVIFGKIYEAYEKFEARGERLKFEGIIQDVWGEQGKDIVQLLNQNPEMFKHIGEDMKKPMSIQEALTERAKDTNAQWDIFTGNIKTAGMLMGDVVVGDVGNELQWMNDKLFSSDGTKSSPVLQWIEDNKSLIGWVVKSTLAFAGLIAGVGLLKLLGAGIRYALISPLATTCGWLSKGARHAHGLYDSFKYFRKGGGKFFESIWKGAQFAYPWLGKLTRWVGRFTPFWLSNAARIAWGWVVAMGPVGWTIAGVTALIAGGVWAWENNFLGFRDVATDTFNWIRDYADYVCPGMGAKFDELAAGIDNNWKWIKNSTNEALDSMSEKTRGVCDAMGIDFGGVTDKIKTMLTYLSPAAMLWDHIEKFNQYRADKLERNANMANRDYLAQPEYIIPNARGNVSVSQTNHVTVASTNEAADFVGRVEVPKYKGSDYNPLSNGNFAY